MSASGSGKWALDSSSEPLPDPREAASQALAPAFGEIEVTGILELLDDAGLTICWQVPRA